MVSKGHLSLLSPFPLPIFHVVSLKVACFEDQDMDQFQHNFGGPWSFCHLAVGGGVFASQLRRLPHYTVYRRLEFIIAMGGVCIE
jgi:hypothetical protein